LGGATSGTVNTASSSAFALVAGSNITLSQNSTSPNITIQGASGAAATISLVQNYPLNQAGGEVVSATGTVSAIGSSLLLQRLYVPALLNLTEVDLALGITFPSSSQGAGTLSQSFILYSIVGGTALSSVLSISGTSAWTTGLTTVIGSISLTEFQGGWSAAQIHPMTFASTSIAAGEYVVGHLLNFAQVSSTWTVALYGAMESLAQSTSITAFTASPTAANALSSGGLAGGSVHTASSSSSLTAWSAAPTGMSAMSSSGLVAFGSSKSFITAANSTTGLFLGASAGSVSVSGLGSAATTVSLVTTAGSFHSASGSGAVMSNAGTAAFAGFLGSGGLSAGSFHTATGSVAAISNAGTAQINPLYPTIPSFVYIGTGSSTGANAALPSCFIAGIMSTGAAPASIALSTTALTFSGTAVNAQPWMAMIGS
jgi:hypothetical protein